MTLNALPTGEATISLWPANLSQIYLSLMETEHCMEIALKAKLALDVDRARDHLHAKQLSIKNLSLKTSRFGFVPSAPDQS